MPQETKSKVSASADEQSLQGHTADASDQVALRKAVELALDYRGDVTITRSGGEALECFIFDLKDADDLEKMVIRVMPKDRDEKLAIRLAEVASIAFTGRDTAAGRSFQTWMKKYVEKKLAGEVASIESESLD